MICGTSAFEQVQIGNDSGGRTCRAGRTHGNRAGVWTKLQPIAHSGRTSDACTAYTGGRGTDLGQVALICEQVEAHATATLVPGEIKGQIARRRIGPTNPSDPVLATVAILCTEPVAEGQRLIVARVRDGVTARI